MSPINPVNEHLDICFTFTRDGVKEFPVWEVMVPMDNAMQVAIGQQQFKYTQVLSELTGAAGSSIQYEVFAFGVMGAIPVNFEKVLQKLCPSSQTD